MALQKDARENLWNLLDDNGNGLLSLAESKEGMFNFFKKHPVVIANEKKFKLITKSFNLAKNFFPSPPTKNINKKKKI